MADIGKRGHDRSDRGLWTQQQGDGHKYSEVARDKAGPLEGKLEDGRRMLTNTGKIPKGNTRLAGDNRGKSVWLKGKESGVTRRPRH